MAQELDGVDLGILDSLATDARHTTATEIADRVGVSPSTVRNRLGRLEDAGVIRGYYPDVDYQAAGLSLQVLLVCTATGGDRARVFDDLLDVDGVVDAHETMTDRRNVYVDGVATGTADVDRLADDVRATGLAIERAEVVRRRRREPCNHPIFRGTVGETPSET